MEKRLLLFSALLSLLIITVACKSDKKSNNDQLVTGNLIKHLFTKAYTDANRLEGIDPMGQYVLSELSKAEYGIKFCDYKVASIEYTTLDADNESINVSGIISYPVGIDKFRGVILAPMYTVLANKECPSNTLNSVHSVYAWLGYVVITPDYIGFNKSSNIPHPYLHRKLTGKTCVDMLKAATKYMEQEKMPIGKDIYLLGFSQGGASALITQRMIQEQYSADFNILEVYSAAGPHDLKTMFDDYSKNKTSNYPCSVPNIFLGLNYGDKLELNMDKVFIGDLLKNYDQWYLSKTKTSEEVNALLGTTDLTKFIHGDMFTAEKSEDMNKVKASCAANSALGDWKPIAPIHFFYSTTDTFVPDYNTVNAYNNFNEKGCKVTKTELQGDHLQVGVQFFIRTALTFALK